MQLRENVRPSSICNVSYKGIPHTVSYVSTENIYGDSSNAIFLAINATSALAQVEK